MLKRHLTHVRGSLDGHLHRCAGLGVAENFVDLFGVSNNGAVDGLYNVAFQQAYFRGA